MTESLYIEHWKEGGWIQLTHTNHKPGNIEERGESSATVSGALTETDTKQVRPKLLLLGTLVSTDIMT
jgi:hypothetical protein